MAVVSARLQVLRTVEEIRRAVRTARAAGRRIGFIPTMGALHEGHRSLIRRARAENDFIVVSIFVNPAQFGPREDYTQYPRDLERDCQECATAGVDVVFIPEVGTMYPPGDSTRVAVDTLTEGMCAAHRPGHFRAVTTVCTRLFNIVQADRAYFGEKDYQQLKVIQRMVRDLHIPTTIVPCPTVRDADGVALSSRNACLTAEEREAARTLYRALQAAQVAVATGTRDGEEVLRVVHDGFAQAPRVRLQYAELRDPETLARVTMVHEPTLLALAAFAGDTRLIDNLILRPND